MCITLKISDARDICRFEPYMFVFSMALENAKAEKAEEDTSG